MILETDYLIVGSGAVGMGFADVILNETNANIIIVDRCQKPGGHWNDAYPFVTLHQPSTFYGVSSTELGKTRKDKIGLNKGLNNLSSGEEIMAYYDEIMNHQFLPSGRVQYFPLCDYKGEGNFKSTITGKSYKVNVRNKIVDATYLKATIPATHTPSFDIDNEVKFMPINDLTKITNTPEGFVVVGGGKTGIDACLWLLKQDVDPDKITWIMPRDGWFTDRINAQPTEEFFEYSLGNEARQLEAIANADSVVDLFERLEDSGCLLRLDKNVRPTMFHGAIVSRLELEELRRIKTVVRMGRIKQIKKDEIILEQGTIPTSLQQIHVDCSASVFRSSIKIKPVFQGNVITPQTVRPYQPVFSAAFIAHVEAAYDDEKLKNKLCKVIPLPNIDTDFIKTLFDYSTNQRIWNKDKKLTEWLSNNRLAGVMSTITKESNDKDDQQKKSLIKRIQDNNSPAMIKLHQFVSELLYLEEKKEEEIEMNL